MTLQELKLSSHARQRANERFVHMGRVNKAKEWYIKESKQSKEVVEIVVKYSNKKNVRLIVDIMEMVVVTVIPQVQKVMV